MNTTAPSQSPEYAAEILAACERIDADVVRFRVGPAYWDDRYGHLWPVIDTEMDSAVGGLDFTSPEAAQVEADIINEAYAAGLRIERNRLMSLSAQSRLRR